MEKLIQAIITLILVLIIGYFVWYGILLVLWWAFNIQTPLLDTYPLGALIAYTLAHGLLKRS